MRTFCLSVVVVSLFLMPACSSPGQEGNGGSGAGPHGDKPSAIQGGCNGKATGCERYEYNSHGDIEKFEACADVTCQQWCDKPYLSYCITYEYDAQGRVVKEMYHGYCNMSSDPGCSVYIYDDHGSPLSKKDCKGPNVNDTCWELTYDSQGRIQTKFRYYCESKAGECSTFTYDDQGRIVTEQKASGACGNSQNTICIKYEYEGDTVNLYVGEGNCENMGKLQCYHYIY